MRGREKALSSNLYSGDCMRDPRSSLARDTILFNFIPLGMYRKNKIAFSLPCRIIIGRYCITVSVFIRVTYLNRRRIAGLRPSFRQRDIMGDGSVKRASVSEYRSVR